MKPAKYYPAFDFLRLVLAIVVASNHAGLIGWSNSGNFAVQIFFALSGWLIGGILANSSTDDLSRFYFNRAARIWIPYFVAIGLLMLASLLKDRITPKWIEIFFYDLTFVYNFFGPSQLAQFHDAMPLNGTGSHFWSICAEEQFYLLAPLLIVVMPTLIGKNVIFWAVISIAVLFSPYWSNFGSISLGVLAAISVNHFGAWHNWRSIRVAASLIAAGGLPAIVIGYADYRAFAPIVAISIVLCFAWSGKHSKIGEFLGGDSYPMYLNHWIGVFFANVVFARFAMRETLTCKISGVVFAFAIASALYIVVDRTVRRNRSQFFTTLRGKLSAGVGASLVSVGLFTGWALTR